MQIRMYNCGYGDCFRLKNNDKKLLVDFGSLQLPKNYTGNLNQLFDTIIEDNDNHWDFLLTHYHKDHFNGAWRMRKLKNNRFNNVYVPDIWNEIDSVKIVTLFLLRSLLNKNNIDEQSFLDLLITICEVSGKVFFVKEGTIIQNCYIALWPSYTNSYLKKHTNTLINSIGDEYNIKELEEIATQVYETFGTIEGMELEEIRNITVKRLREIKNDYLNIVIDSELSSFNSIRTRLNNYVNKFSIVFQNKENTDNNILFTGDFGKIWDEIKHKMYSEYKLIKIPHHGTKGYYHKFNCKYFLVPNFHCVNSKSRLAIDSRYVCDSFEQNGKIYYNGDDDRYICQECKKQHLINSIDIKGKYKDFTI